MQDKNANTWENLIAEADKNFDGKISFEEFE